MYSSHSPTMGTTFQTMEEIGAVTSLGFAHQSKCCTPTQEQFWSFKGCTKVVMECCSNILALVSIFWVSWHPSKGMRLLKQAQLYLWFSLQEIVCGINVIWMPSLPIKRFWEKVQNTTKSQGILSWSECGKLVHISLLKK